MKAIRPAQPCLLHGGRLRLPQARIDATVGALVQGSPHLDQPRYRHALGLLARVVARIEVMDEIYTEHPRAWLLRATSSGRIQMGAGEKHYVALIEQARRLLADLGLTPQSARALGLSVESPDAVDVFRAEMLRQERQAKGSGGGGA